MGKKDPRIDTYIKKSAPFAQPILKHMRKLVHTACPEVQETIKWGFPHFEYNGILCSLASFKQHCAFGFWNASAMKDPQKLLTGIGKTAMGQFGQLTSVGDLPADSILIQYIKEAARVNTSGVKPKSKTKSKAKTAQRLSIPADVKIALNKNKKALKTFEEFSHTNKKDYIEWITEAKQEATRKKRLQTAIEWMAEGKIRNWKYIKK